MSQGKKPVFVRDVMHNNYCMVDGLITVEEAIRTFKSGDYKALIINKRHASDEFGLLLLSDIAKKVIAKDKSPERVNVYEIMAKPVLNVKPDMDIKYCARMFEQFGINRSPVVENGEVIGLVGYTNMVLNSVGVGD